MGYGEKSCDVRHHLLGPSISGKCLNNRKKIRLATFINKLPSIKRIWFAAFHTEYSRET
jgi:hypothetical protein